MLPLKQCAKQTHLGCTNYRTGKGGLPFSGTASLVGDHWNRQQRSRTDLETLLPEQEDVEQVYITQAVS
jgi:hypothetical protein